MNKLNLLKSYTTWALILTTYLFVAPTPTKADSSFFFSYGLNTCSSGEKWFKANRPLSEKGAIDYSWIEAFTAYLQGKVSPAMGFSQGLALRRLASYPHERAFSEYWISRALLGSGMIHLAEAGFKSLLNEKVTVETAPFQLASLQCLTMIHKNYGVFALNRSQLLPQLSALVQLLPQLSDKQDFLMSPIWNTTLLLLVNDPESNEGKAEMDRLLKNSGPYQALANGLTRSTYSKQDFSIQTQLIQDLDLFLKNPNLPSTLIGYRDHAHLLLGRAWYSIGEYDNAASSYRQIGVRSNEWVHALSELSWAYLMSEKYRDAIGVAVGVQSGAIRHTFCPESMMVMAMALNEMCYFPESLKIVKKFRKDYSSSYYWLKEQSKTLSSQPSVLYRLAVDFARNSPEMKVPLPVASEWVRSPSFLNNQERINLVLRERQTSEKLSKQGLQEQRTRAQLLVQTIRKIKVQIQKTRIKMAANDSLPSDLIKKIEEIKKGITDYRRIKAAAPIWRKMVASNQIRGQTTIDTSISKISSFIVRLNQRMLGQLEEIAENNELLEVEIFNGASEDMIWQNAHPDYKKLAQTHRTLRNEGPTDQVWDWGNTVGGLDGRGEIWEDEVGSLTANLQNHCDNKDKYLAIKESDSYSNQ